MENNVLSCTTADIFKNGDIIIEIPLTGKNVPTVFKTFIVECITRGEARNILDDDDLLNELLEKGSAHNILTMGQISLLLKIDPNGEFSEDMTLAYTTYENGRKSTMLRKIKYFEISYSDTELYHKKALRMLKRRVEKGLKQFTTKISS